MIERKLRKQDRELSQLRQAPDSESKTFDLELSAICKRSTKRPKQTDRKIVWKKEELFRLSSDQFQKHLWVSTKILPSAWEEHAPLKSCLTADLTVLNVLLRTEEGWGTSPRGRSFKEQFWFRILLPGINTSKRLLPRWGNTSTLCRNCADCSLVRRRKAQRKI